MRLMPFPFDLLKISHCLPFVTSKPSTTIPKNHTSLTLSNWRKELDEICHATAIERLSIFFNQSIPQVIEKLDRANLQSLQPVLNQTYYPVEVLNLVADSNQVSKQTKSDAQRHRFWSLQFFSNFIDTFISSFNFFDGSEPATSFYEKSALTQIYFNFFKIPFAIACILQPFLIVTWKVYTVTAGLIGLVMLSIDCYRYFRPFPKVVPHCENIEEMVAKEFSTSIRGLNDEVGQLIACLNSDQSNLKKKPVMLVAGSGNGKTTLIYKLHQMIKNGDVPASLKNKKILILNGGEIMAKASMGFGDKIKEIKHRLKGFEKEVIVFIDEIQAVATDAACFEKMKEFMRVPGLQFIAATTELGMSRTIQTADFDHSFRRPFHYIHLGKWKNAQVKSLIEEVVYNQTQDIIFMDEAIDKIIELSNAHLEDLPQPGKALKLLDLIISSCRANYAHYQPKKLTEKQMELNGLQYRWARNFPNNNSFDHERINALSQEIKILQNEQTANLKKSHFLQKLIVNKNEIREKTLKEAFALIECKRNKQIAPIAIQKSYFFHHLHLLPFLQEMINNQMNALEKSMDLKVDIGFVQKVFDQNRELEQGIHA